MAQKNDWMDTDFLQVFSRSFSSLYGYVQGKKGMKVVLIFDGATMHCSGKLAKLAVFR